jgi:hypothetical protein
VLELVGRKQHVGTMLALYGMPKKRWDMQWKRHGPSEAANRPLPSITAPKPLDGHLPRPQELEHRANDVVLTVERDGDQITGIVEASAADKVDAV